MRTVPPVGNYRPTHPIVLYVFTILHPYTLTPHYSTIKMKITGLALAVAATVAQTHAGVPTFPGEWNSDTASKLILFQGGVYNSTDGSACCPKSSPGCKVQAQGQMGTNYVDSANNQTAFSVGSQAIITRYNDGKEYLVAPSTTTKGAWTCQSYCPLQDNEFFNPLTFDPSAQDLGKATINGQTYEHYQWQDKLFKTISMDTQDWYITPGANPVPFMNVESLTPFGGPRIAVETEEFDNFKSGLSGFSFKIDNAASCQESDKCQQNNGLTDRFLKKHFKNKAQIKRSLYDQAKEKTQGKSVEMMLNLGNKKGQSVEMKLNLDLANKKDAAASWPNDFSTTETSEQLIDQGGQPGPDGSTCCTSSFSAQCQVQYSYSSGMKYYDYTNQRTRMEDPVNGIVVGLYSKDGKTAGKNMLVVHNGTHDVCEKYCPIDPEDTLDTGKNYFLDPNATDLGKVTYKGQAAEHYQWSETIFKVIKMQTTDFYATEDDIPLGAKTQLTPFGGPAIGGGTVSWEGFKAGTPPAAKFDIAGVDSCPQDPQCGQPSLQHRRLLDKQFHTFARYHYTN